MPHGIVQETIPAPSADVFGLLHNYDRRLEWDTLLKEAYLTDGYHTAQTGAVSVCRGKSWLGGFAVKTEYVSFRPPDVAAVKLINRPPFFDTFAATIRHHDLPNGESSIEYTYNFTTRPKWLRLFLHPMLNAIFVLETKKRLRTLRKFFQAGPTQKKA
ncbi:MAG TPA: SRPBCC family protein [Pirellulales bacterium]